MIFKNLTFDGISLKEYGVYISGEAVFDSPTRDVEMVTIPGRNGSFALDKGRFNNITVTYPAGIYATSQTEFAEKVSTLRNLLASRKGYCRLTDEYNPDEFRLGVYKAGLELDPTHYNEAGRFELSFDCKPQRFLFSGEEVFTLGEWGETETYSGSIASFEGDETTAIKSLTAQIVPKQSGSGDPSPSNVRPISGYSEVVTSRVGKNLLKNTASTMTHHGITYTVNADGTITANGTATDRSYCVIDFDYDYFYNHYKDGTYILSGCPSGGSMSTYALDLQAYGSGNLYDIGEGVTINTSQLTNQQYRFVIDIKVGTTMNNAVFKPMLRLANTSAEYESYNGTTYPISLGQTVYGGTLEVMSGKLTVDYVNVDMGSINWTMWNGKFVASLPDAFQSLVGNTTIVSEIYKTGQWGSSASQGEDMIWLTGSTSNAEVYVQDSTYTDKTTFKTAVTGKYMAYKLKTPTEVTLTPTEVKTLLGANKIWTDSGDVTVEIGQNPNVLVNPTLFEACPLIEFNASGSGSINLGSKKMEFFNSPLGTINLPFTVSTTEASADTSDYVEFSGSYNTGDKFRVKGSKATFNLTAPSTITSVSFPTGMDLAFRPNESSFSGTNALTTVEDWQETEFTIGTSSTVTKTYTPSYSFGGSSHTATFTLQLIYDGDTTIRMKWTATLPSGMTLNRIAATNSKYTLVCDSTANSLTGDLYIDLDIGEAYKVEDDSITSINNFVNLGGELPTLDPGATEISTDDSISNVKVTPRWWKV